MDIVERIISRVFGPDPAQVSEAEAAGPASTDRLEGGPRSRADVEAMIEKLASGEGRKLEWRTSIVDLMELLGLDSDLAAREQLARELGYTGALDGSPEMNRWLHEQVMLKLAESGGRVPESLS